MSALPYLLPEKRPITPWDLGVLLAGLALVVAPHALRAPVWLTLLTLALYCWRAAALAAPALMPARWLLLVVALAGMLGVWLEFRAIFGRTPGIMLLVLFSGLKMLESRNQRDAAAVVFLAWFLAITNFLYTQSIATALGMMAAVAATVLSLVGFAGPRRTPRANARTAAVLLAQAVPAALVLFLLFPRVQGPLWGLPQDAYQAISGLSETMSPGNISRLTLSDAIAFRVEFEGEAPRRRAQYWRGPVMWDFDGRSWRLGTPAFAELPARGSGGTEVKYSILLEPHNRNWLFALEAPVTLPPNGRYMEDGQIITLAPVRARMRYDMTSVIEAEPRPDEAAHNLRRALRLPPGYNPRAHALAAGWRDRARNDVDILNAAIEFFRREKLMYTTEPPPLGRDSVDEFLWETRQGFCEHFSSAFVYLMRAAGVPARVVTGYHGGDLNPVDGKFTVRQADAHAWTEIYLGGRGWLRVDPTALSVPGRLDDGLASSVPATNPLPLLLRREFEWLRELRYNWEALSHQWNLWVLGYNPARQRQLMSWFGMQDADWLELASTLVFVLGVFVAGLLAWSLRHLARPDPVQSAWLSFCRKLGRRGVARAPHEGPQDYAERAARRLPGADAMIRDIAARYIALRYGARRPAAAFALEAAELRRRVRELHLA